MLRLGPPDLGARLVPLDLLEPDPQAVRTEDLGLPRDFRRELAGRDALARLRAAAEAALRAPLERHVVAREDVAGRDPPDHFHAVVGEVPREPVRLAPPH